MQRIALLLAGAVAATVAAPGCAQAADTPDTADRYSHVMPLQVSGKQAVVQLRLPRDVYLHARTPDLADLRVFDATGNPQPYALRRAPLQQAQAVTLPAAVFPVFAPGDRHGIDNIEVRTSPDGSLVSVSARPGGAPRAAGDVLAALMLDLGPIPSGTTVSALTFTLPPGVANYSAGLAVEASNDLQHWESLAEADVSWLTNSRGESVRSDRIAFSPRPFRYARIRWQDGAPVEFQQVAAQAIRQQDVPRQWETVILQPQPAASKQDLVYKAPVAVPAESAGLVLQGRNVVVSATIGQYAAPSRAAPERDAPAFRPLASATFYQLQQDGKPRVSGDVVLPETRLAQWVVRPKGDVASLPELPALRLKWQPATLVFVAGGKPPYTLAFGQPGARSMARPLGQVAPGFDAQELAQLESAVPGQVVQQHAVGAAEEDTAGRKVWWLWGLLVCGVGVLGWMAWRLVAQLKGEDAGSKPQE